MVFGESGKISSTENIGQSMARCVRKSNVVPYQRPWRVERVEDCDFYHTTDLPGLGIQQGQWDIRKDVDAYIGNLDYCGKTVLDVGTGSGFLAFEMEKRGAQVIAFDFDGGNINHQHDLIPYFDFEQRFGDTYPRFFEKLLTGLDMMKNSFWLSHFLSKSKVKAFYGNVYDCEVDFGHIDYVFFGNILLHLMSPIKAINTFSPYASSKIIITEACFHETYDYQSDEAVCFLVPGIEQNDNFASWWQLTPGFLKRYLGIHGFNKFNLSFHDALWVKSQKSIRHFTLVASR